MIRIFLFYCATIVAAFVMSNHVWADATEPVQNSEQKPPSLPLFVMLPQQDVVLYKGVVNYDTAGIPGGNMAYPAPSAGGFLVALATHALLNSAMKSSQKTKMEAEADKVLLPYQAYLGQYTYSELMTSALGMVNIDVEKEVFKRDIEKKYGIVVDGLPVFSMTQDQRSIVMDVSMALYGHGVVAIPDKTINIKIISNDKKSTDYVAFWGGNEGRAIKTESANLLAQAIVIAYNSTQGKLNNPAASFKTVRYKEGGVEKMERAQVLSEVCGRVLLKNLRGDLMSIPSPTASTPDASTHACAA